MIRPAAPGDFAAVADIYAHWVRHGLASFEETPPSADALAARAAEIAATGLPYLVAEAERRVVGFASASAYRPRSGYRYTVEDAVYVAPGRHGRGIGKALLDTLIAACEAKGVRQMLASVGDTGNQPSIALHRACGFETVGVLRAVGFKHGRWVDVVFMQRALNGGDATAPVGTGWL